jgi:hypothetical protein
VRNVTGLFWCKILSMEHQMCIVNTVMNVTHTAATTAVSIVNSYSMENQAIMVQFLAEARDLSILDSIQPATNYMQPPIQ